MSRATSILFWLLVGTAFLLPYEQVPWWSFPASTLALAVLFGLRWRGAALARTGLPRDARRWAVLAMLLVACAAASAWWIGGRAEQAGLELRAFELPRRGYPILQALHEEVVLGYLPLAALARRIGAVYAVLSVSALFAALHVSLYAFGAYQTWLAPTTVLGLFAVGLLRNALIVGANHIGIAWALHAGWNWTMFGGRWSHHDGSPVGEPELFGTLVGEPSLVAVASIAAVAALAWCARSVRDRRRCW